MLKKIIRILVGSILLVACAMPLMAAWNFDQQMRVDVPFAFTANDTHLPAGKYTVSVHPDTGRIIMEGEGQTPLIFMTIPKESFDVGNRGKLVFLKSGSAFSLIEVWTRGNTTGQTLPINAETKENIHQKQPKKGLVIAIP